MKVLSIGTDQKVLQANSSVALRAIRIGQFLDKYCILIPGSQKSLDLAANTRVISSGGANKLVRFYKIFKQAKYLLQTEHYDLITVQDTYYLAYLGLLLAKKFKIKLEVQVHGLEKFSGLRKILARAVWQQADSIRVVSTRLKNYLVNVFKIPADKINVLPVLVDLEKLKSSSLSIDLRKKYPGQFIFLFVGRLVAVKNLPLLFKALAKLDNPKDYKLIIIGDGPDKDKLLSLANNLGLAEQIEFLGWLDNLVDFYRSADCLVLSSDSEGRGMVVEEAVACGLPVIMTDVGLAGELVKNNINGLIVPVGEEVALSEALSKVLKEPGLLAAWRQHNLQLKNLDSEDFIKMMFINWQRIL